MISNNWKYFRMKGFLPIRRCLLVKSSTDFRARCIFTYNEYALGNRIYVYQHIDMVFLSKRRYHHLINNCIRAASYLNNSYTIKWKHWMGPTMTNIWMEAISMSPTTFQGQKLFITMRVSHFDYFSISSGCFEISYHLFL